MFDNEAKYQLATAGSQIGMPMMQTRRQRLEELRRHLEAHLARVNDAIKALDDNPSIEDLINKIDKAL